jgi:hypothetical protein
VSKKKKTMAQQCVIFFCGGVLVKKAMTIVAIAFFFNGVKV